MNNEIRETFADILIEPAYSEILHRNQIDTSSQLGGIKLNLPIVSANMRHITEAKMCSSMCEAGGLGIIHRFMSIEDAVEEFKKAQKLCGKQSSVGVSIGVKPEDKNRFTALREAGAKIFCIDVAHGHHILVKKMLQWIRLETSRDHKDKPILIAGNVATWEGVVDLHSWGASVVKVGVGPGSACQTRRNAGIGVPQLYALRAIKEKLGDTHIPIISDGGIVHTGDIPKALKYADAVMVAFLIAGTIETPGSVYEDEQGSFYKVFGGSASGENKVANGQENSYVEGSLKLIPFRGHVKHILKKTHEMIQTSFSYVGARDIEEFRKRAELCLHTSGSRSESKI